MASKLVINYSTIITICGFWLSLWYLQAFLVLSFFLADMCTKHRKKTFQWRNNLAFFRRLILYTVTISQTETSLFVCLNFHLEMIFCTLGEIIPLYMGYLISKTKLFIQGFIYEFAFETYCQISGPCKWTYTQKTLFLIITISFYRENGIFHVFKYCRAQVAQWAR
jgi:hypothetical protein